MLGPKVSARKTSLRFQDVVLLGADTYEELLVDYQSAGDVCYLLCGEDPRHLQN